MSRASWISNNNKWTEKPLQELLRKAEDRDGWRRFVVVTSMMIPPTIEDSRK